MKLRKISIFALLFGLFLGKSFAATPDFQIAAQLLRAARAGDIQTVERLINSGANVNYIDSTGMSIACTAIMNNDFKAAQILQIYGADASQCNRQIRRYRDGLPKENSGGLFSGLSNTQNLTLAAGGAALVIAGVYFFGGGLLGNDDKGAGPGGEGQGGGGSHGNGDGDGGGDATIGPSMAYGPSEWNFETNQPNKTFNVSATIDALFSPGDTTVPQLDFEYMSSIRPDVLGRWQNYLLMMGGYAPQARGYFGQITSRNTPLNNNPNQSYVTSLMRPITVALITANGVNPTGTAKNQEMCLNRDEVVGCGGATDKYNRYLNIANGLETNISVYDFSGANTVFDTNADEYDSLLAKIIVGGTAAGDERDTADFIGFMPNGQLALYRTGGGVLLTDKITSFSIIDDANININGTGLTYTLDAKGNFVASDGNTYALSNGDLYMTEEQAYKNWEAIRAAFATSINFVIANAATPDTMRTIDAPGIGAVTSLSGVNRADMFRLLINDYYYGGNGAPSNLTDVFTAYGSGNASLLVFGAGEAKCTRYANGRCLDDTLFATFENSAPLVFPGLKHQFMTAVAVQYSNGTNGTTSAAGTLSGGKYQLSNYMDFVGDFYAARGCGTAGIGGTVDPWCFSAAGITADQAVASLAGAAGVLMGAFRYMTTSQIFALMALTADGKFYSQSELESMYQLPADLAAELPASTDPTYGDKWKEAFARAYGYGMVNLDRATTPNTNLYFYDGGSTKTGYWSSTPAANRAATVFRPGKAFGGQRMTISTPMFDFIANSDGTESMPRVFDTEFSFGGTRHGATLDSMLDGIDFSNPIETSDKKIEFHLSNDGTEIKNLKLSSNGFLFGYKERTNAPVFTNDNPIMSLAGNMAAFGYESQFTNHGFRATAFTGKMTDEALLETDPALIDMNPEMTLGNVYGASFNYNSQFTVNSQFTLGVGYMSEDRTTLGSETGGLFDFGGGKTLYANAEIKIWKFRANYTMAKTETNPGFGFIESISDLYSDSYGLSADFGKWSFGISRPLAVTRGMLRYMHTDYAVVEGDLGYDLETTPSIREIDLAPKHRETNIRILYTPEVSEKTNLAFGIAGRINPDNTKGVEHMFMMKFKHIW